MKNFHQKSDLIDQETITKIEKALEESWSIETTDPERREKWSKENKALGQCAVTAVLIFDLFGGRMIYDKKNFHIWNEFPDGTEQDFTRSQFTDERTFSIYKYKTKEDILYDERGLKNNIAEKYQKLNQRFLQNLNTKEQEKMN